MSQISSQHSEIESSYNQALEEGKRKVEEKEKEDRNLSDRDKGNVREDDAPEQKNEPYSKKGASNKSQRDTGKSDEKNRLDMSAFDEGSSQEENSQVTSDTGSSINMEMFEEKQVRQQSPAKTDKNYPVSNKQGSGKGSGEILGSVMLLIDTSGSMKGSKIASAKDAAINAAKRALDKKIEVAVYAFSGGCSNPIRANMPFSDNFEEISTFINSLSADGGTPLAPALEISSSFLADNKSSSSQHQMTVLLADGDNQCGNINDTLNLLRQRGQIFRHETIGLEIEPYSQASKDLQDIASKTGGQYRAANDVQQLASVFNDAIDTITMLEMLGGFGEKGKGSVPKRKGSK